jgi:hypothetical protein
MSYDIIGDIHGHADALKTLLHQLGYREQRGAWRHPERQAIFVGDFIDRGPQQLETLATVRAMVEAGSARAVMGNHELNAIAWFLPDPANPGEHLRPHHSAKYGAKNRQQHQAFLDAVEGRAVHRTWVKWFLTLPLWLDLPELRVIHACWHPSYLGYLTPLLTAERCLTEALMVPATLEPDHEAEKDSPEPSVYKAVEALLKGIEMPLPEGVSYRDKDGHERRHARVRWWDAEAGTVDRAALLSDAERAGLPAHPVPDHLRVEPATEKPIFVGHYWMNGTPGPLSDSVVCVDYSVAKGGKLVAYRWDGETTTNAAQFHWVDARSASATRNPSKKSMGHN